MERIEALEEFEELVRLEAVERYESLGRTEALEGFEELEMDVIEFEAEDILTTSGGSGDTQLPEMPIINNP